MYYNIVVQLKYFIFVQYVEDEGDLTINRKLHTQSDTTCSISSCQV